MNIPAFLSDRFVFTIETVGDRRKVFQILFGKRDGSLFVSFPYYRYPTGLLSVLSLKARQTFPASISLVEQGKVTSHRVKYSHHPDGVCLFSQDGKIFSKIRRQSVPLTEARGHLFTVQLQGLSDFKEPQPHERRPLLSAAKTLINFKFEAAAPEACKFVAYCYPVTELASMLVKIGSKPWFVVQKSDGSKAMGALLSGSALAVSGRYCLLLTCEAIPRLDADRQSTLTFVGGFDRPDVAFDHSKDTAFLALAYPTAEDHSQLIKRIGSVDFTEPELI